MLNDHFAAAVADTMIRDRIHRAENARLAREARAARRSRPGAPSPAPRLPDRLVPRFHH